MKPPPPARKAAGRADREAVCRARLERIRFPDGPHCLRCGGGRVFRFVRRQKGGKPHPLYECVDCRYQFSLTAGSVFHDSRLPLSQWFRAIALFCAAEETPSAKQLQRELRVTYKTAWRMAARIRLARQEDPQFCRKFGGLDAPGGAGGRPGHAGRRQRAAPRPG